VRDFFLQLGVGVCCFSHESGGISVLGAKVNDFLENVLHGGGFAMLSPLNLLRVSDILNALASFETLSCLKSF